MQAEVIEDMKTRAEHGMREYGVPLLPHNGRRSLQDAYEEVLDLAMYVKQRLMEEDRFVKFLTDIAQHGGDAVPAVLIEEAKSILGTWKGVS